MKIFWKSIAPAKWYLLVLLGILMAFGGFILSVGHAESFRLLNGYHNVPANGFFRYVTHLGDGIFILALAAVFAIFKRYQWSIGVVAGYLLSGIFAQLGKKLLNLPRPLTYFENLNESIYQVPGVNTHAMGSFPSGHTTSVFALMVYLVLALPPGKYKWLLVLAAILVGYSRIYLSQHFPVDVWAGALIGSICGIVVFIWLKRVNERKLSRKRKAS